MSNDWLSTLAKNRAHVMISADDLESLLRCLASVSELPGDVAELGCNVGDTSVVIATAMLALMPGKRLHVFDTFTGLPQRTTEDGACSCLEGAFSATEDDVANRFITDGLQPPVIHKGLFSAIADYPPQLSFVFLDGDLYHSILDGLTAVYPRMIPGGVIVVHDCTNPEFPGVRRACSEFLSARPEVIEASGDLGIIRIQHG